MSERDGYIPGVPCWVDSSQPDPKAAAGFYGELFGWDLEDVMPEGAGVSYFIGRIRGGDVGAVGPVPEGAPPRANWNTYIWVDDVEATAAKVRQAGGQATDPMDVMDAGRTAMVTDPEGATFMLWQAGRHRGSKIVNEHGSVNFNNLVTADVDQAESFYGAVFGWKALDLPSGTVWTRPGYGDHLEASTPGLRQQMADMGAPDGFIDVVAAVEPMSDAASGPARWTVTFGVDDVDAIAAKAKGLGAKVVTEPHDMPWSRQALLEDPQGARFVVSQFVAENSNIEV